MHTNMFVNILFVVVICLCGNIICGDNEKPIITTPYGKIRGSYALSYKNNIYSKFQSVPYAQPPTGDLRFQEPQALKNWNGIWEANFTSVCAQINHVMPEVGGYYEGQEDCLHLTIYVPRKIIEESAMLDVIVDIHGGGFNFGSNSVYSSPEFIMDTNVILVTINYRLGILGFLSMEDEIIPGNNGMKDQVEALKWIKNNIIYFGGNPESITLVGLSAGGASVHFHYLSPLSKGLFKGGISFSGNALCPWVLQENALKQATLAASSVGCTQDSTIEIVRCLRQRPVKQIVESTKIFRHWLFNPFSVFGLVVEKHGNNPFLPLHPFELLVNGEVQDLPWITTVVSHEGLYPVIDFIMKDHYLPELETRWNELAPHILHFETTIAAESLPSVTNSIRSFYFKDKPISIDTYQNLIEVASDRLFLVDSEKAARLQARANKSPTYYYYFSYAGEEKYSFTDYFAHFEKRHGVCHGDDVAFVYHNHNLPLTPLTNSDEKMKDILLQIWTSFANTGVPDVLGGPKWTPVDKEPNKPFNYLHIMSPNDMVLKQTNEIGHRSFWDSLPFEENQNLFPSLIKDEL